MNGDQHQPGAPTSAASFAPAPARPPPLSSSRPSPFPASSSATLNAMAAPPFLPSTQTPFRSPAPVAQSSYSLAAAAATAPIGHFADREAGTKQSMLLSYRPSPAAVSPPGLSSAVIRMLPPNTSEDSIRLMLVFSKDLVNVDILPPEQNEDAGFCSALLTFKTPAGAHEVKNMLDGKSNISNDANMIVEVLGSSSPTTSGTRFPIDTSVSTHGSSTTASSSGASSATSAASLSRQVSRFNATFALPQSLGKISPPLNGGTAVYGGGDLTSPDSASAHNYQNIFSPQSPIGNHLTDPRARISSKTLINDDSGADDETRELLNDPLAYAENGSLAAQRRATAPQIPTSRLAGLSLSTPPHTGPSAPPSQMSPYGHLALGNIPTHSTAMSPTAMSGSAPPMAFAPSFRQQFPPANPADQNPPCNTLYVGNLPIDTSEEELKALFSKQRGYKRLCFRTKSNGPMCFVEFEDVSFATKALHELYGHPLHNSIKGGIRLSFSKNPLGVRSGQTPNGLPQASVGGGANGMGNGMLGNSGSAMSRFTTASGPPPGLSAPPGLNSVGGPRLGGFNSASSPSLTTVADAGLWNNHYQSAFSISSHSNPWGMNIYNSPSVMASASSKPPPHMLGR